MNLLTIFSVLLGFSAVCYFLLSMRLLRGEREIGSLPLGITFLIISFWVIGGAIEMMATNYVIFSIGRMGHYFGTALVPVALLMSFREFTGRVTATRTVVELSIIPVLTIFVAATNHWHEFMWYLPATNEAGQFLTRPREFGPWFHFVHVPYGYLITGSSLLTLIMHSPAVAPSQRRGLFLLAGSALVPVFGIVAYDLGIGPDTVSTLPIILAMMLPIYGWMVVSERIIEFSPLAYETVFQNMQDPVIVVDDQERIIGLNHGAEILLNMNEHDAMRVSLDSVFGSDASEVHTAIATGDPQKMLTSSGRFLHVQVTPIASNGVASRNARVLMFRDVSDVEKAQREVLNSEKLLRTLIDHSVNGIIRLRWIAAETPGEESELRCIFANAVAGRYLNSEPAAMIDSTVEHLLDLCTNGMDPVDTESLLERFLASAKDGKVIETETRVVTADKTRYLRMLGEPFGEDVTLTFVDVTDDKAKEERMETMARSDPLTGVLNRRGFERDAARRLRESADDASGALLFIDLNDFKLINDQYGHEIGDQLLTIAAHRLQKSLRSCDIIGRPGGDEFVALVPDVEPNVAEKLATRLTRSLEQPYLIGNKNLTCAASTGLALYPEHANTLTGLMRAADAAMYRAKARSRDTSKTGENTLLEKAISA